MRRWYTKNEVRRGQEGSGGVRRGAEVTGGAKLPVNLRSF